MKTARALAFDSLLSLEKSGRYANLEVGAALVQSSLTGADRGLYTRLVYGVTERRIFLDHVMAQYASRSPEEMDPDVRCAVRMGLYQLLCMDRIPEHAAVGESAGLVSGGKRGYVNATLRSFLRGNRAYTLPDPGDFVRYLSVKYSVPEPLVRLFEKSFAGEELEDLLAALNREPHVGLRVNPLRITVEEAAAKCGGTPSKTAPHVVCVDSLEEKARAGLEAGLWFVQDEASRIASAALEAQPGERIADTCACPGGKSFSLALDMENRGEVFSFDLHKNKLSLIRSGAERLGISIIETEARDARQPREDLVGTCDRVLCDAPCSGLGVIAKKPDIRYKDVSDIERLPGIQYEVLTGASRYVKPGGILLYATCTVNRAENEEVVEQFLRENEEFTLCPAPILGGGMRTFLPHRDGCDGFFAARMIRRA